MKIWIDAQLSPAIAKWICQSYPYIEAIAVRDLGLRDAEDAAIFSAAQATNAIIMTKDSDFVELSSRFGSPPKIIWLTCGNTSNASLQKILTTALLRAIDLLEQGADLVEISGV